MNGDTIFSFQTRLTADTLEEILAESCMRKFNVVYKMAEDAARKLVTVTFSDTKDRDRFKAAINSRRHA